MKAQKSILTIFFLCVVSSWASPNQAQNSSIGLKPEDFFQRPQGFLSQLIDPAKFSMTQSYSFSVMSTGGRAFNQGLYSNTMEYKFSDPLVAKVSIGYLHQPFGGMQMQQNSNGQLFIERAMIQYRLSKNTMFTLDFQQVPAPYFWRY